MFSYRLLSKPIAASMGLTCLFASSLIAQEKSPPPGFTSLFNGKDLSGWYGWTTRDPAELWSMSTEEQAKYKKQSIEGGLVDKKGNPINEHLLAHWKVVDGELVNDGHGHYSPRIKTTVTLNFTSSTKRFPKVTAVSTFEVFLKFRFGMLPKVIPVA